MSERIPIYQRVYEVLEYLGPLIARIAAIDRELAGQLRRSAASILLNLAEGMGSSRGTRRMRYETSLGSARETLAALHIAKAWGYLGSKDEDALDQVDHLVAVLVRFTRQVQ